MNKRIIAVIFAPLLLSANASANTSDWAGNVNFFLGQKTLDKDDWDILNEQPEFGVLIDFKKQDWPVSIAIDLLGSSDDVTDSGIFFEGKTSGFDIGVRKIFSSQNSSIKPYIGGGLALVSAEIKGTAFTSVSDDDNGTGLWLNGGIYWTLGQSFNLGFDIRYSQADVTLLGESRKMGGTHVGLMLGYHW